MAATTSSTPANASLPQKPGYAPIGVISFGADGAALVQLPNHTRESSVNAIVCAKPGAEITVSPTRYSSAYRLFRTPPPAHTDNGHSQWSGPFSCVAQTVRTITPFAEGVNAALVSMAGHPSVMVSDVSTLDAYYGPFPHPARSIRSAPNIPPDAACGVLTGALSAAEGGNVKSVSCDSLR